MSLSDKKYTQSKVLVFLKAPKVGYVKTRLARSIGSESALEVYRSLVERQLGEFSTDDSVEIHYAPVENLEEMHNWLGHGYSFYAQCEGGLGLRLEHAVSSAFERGAKSVICIGGDCPGLNRRFLEQTSLALQGGHDLVFGPSKDGGYYLIGLNAPHVELFQEIPWSSQSTLEASLAKASALKLRVKLLETLYDVDEVSELKCAIREKRLLVKPELRDRIFQTVINGPVD